MRTDGESKASSKPCGWDGSGKHDERHVSLFFPIELLRPSDRSFDGISVQAERFFYLERDFLLWNISFTVAVRDAFPGLPNLTPFSERAPFVRLTEPFLVISRANTRFPCRSRSAALEVLV